MSRTSLITGIGACTALGNTSKSTWDALCQGRFITDHSRVPEIDSRNFPRINALALTAAREAANDAKWESRHLQDAAIILGTSKGPVDAWLETAGNPLAANHVAPLFGLAETVAVVAAEMGIRGPRLTVSAACASGLIALIRAEMMIRAGEVSRAIVVAAESSLHPLFLASFKRLGVLPPDGFGCRPFDQRRGGFVVSEAAAAICLEASDAKLAAHASPPLAIERFAFGADATHLTGSDPGGTTLRRILGQVSAGQTFDLIHAHGTGTIANDSMELAAIELCIATTDHQAMPVLYSHKGALGHSLGAAGLLAVAINCLCHRHGIIPAIAHLENPIAPHNVKLAVSLKNRAVNRSIAIAAGFGGAVAAVSIAGAQ